MIYSDKIYNIVLTTSFIYNSLNEKNDKILEDDNLIFFLLDNNNFYNNKELIANTLYTYNPDDSDNKMPINPIENSLYLNIQTMEGMIYKNNEFVPVLYSINKFSLLGCQEKMNKIKTDSDLPYKGQVLIYDEDGEARLSGVTIHDKETPISKDNPSYGALVTDIAVKEYVNNNALSKDGLISDSDDLTEENASDNKVATAKVVLDALTWKTSVEES